MTNNNFFLVNLSPSPLMICLILFLFINSVNNFSWMIFSYINLICVFFIFMFYLLFFYFFIMLNENFFFGKYSKKKKNILVNGFFLFIISELMIFISLFWSFIHNAYSPNMFMGNFWPPKGVLVANPTSMIIFGTCILLSSSLIIMVSHNMMIKNYKYKSLFYLFICLTMGMIFIDMQILEMSNYFLKLNFNFNDSIFSSSFLFTTSLHASHVILGLIGLIFSFYLFKSNNNNFIFYLNFEFSIWYWHFVDYIWIGVFTLFY
uniref:Cytochrome c oxidase subunit 3 n=1 Tax=Amphitetranychus viennensis TaxID=381746 RepID=A0A1L4AHN4_9ACAR|nr:cytochrome c oxidase subunit III [Amphitetranychus viennensis]API67777.1 cytochrome c oxidase subunit III [Amphitetranychus viennensis]